jgi:hypothetical protein
VIVLDVASVIGLDSWADRQERDFIFFDFLLFGALAAPFIPNDEDDAGIFVDPIDNGRQLRCLEKATLAGLVKAPAAIFMLSALFFCYRLQSAGAPKSESFCCSSVR